MNTLRKNLDNQRVVTITNRALGTTFTSYKDLEAVMYPLRQDLLDIWHQSGCTDFSVYRDPRYVFEGIHSWEKTKRCIEGLVNYFTGYRGANYHHGRLWSLLDTGNEFYTGPAATEMSVLDCYNGIGLTTALMQMNGFTNIESFNDCPEQVQFMHAATDELGTGRVLNHTVLPDKKYHIVLSFECLEHYVDPLTHVEDLVRLVQPGGYLIESTGFNGSKDNIGHFDTHMIAGQVVTYQVARKMVNKRLWEEFELLYCGFNKMPRIWRLK